MIRTASRLALAAAAAAAAAGRLDGQAVLLELHPRAGDTLRMRLEQQVEMTGTMRLAGVDSTTTVLTTLRALTHSVVERSDARGAVLVSTTDSVSVVSTGGNAGRHRAGAGAHARRLLEGRRVRLRVDADGATEVLASGGLPPELQAFFSQMPATLPGGRVSVGDVWTRTMQMPAAGRPPHGGEGAVTAAFRLDSLARGGALAYLSMRGSVRRANAASAALGRPRVVGGGTLTGSIVIDRRRGWLSEARTILTLRSTLTPSPESGAPPMQFRMRVQEWLRAVER